MRLVNTTTLRLESFLDERSLPLYAILSHRWAEGEILLADIELDTARSKQGYLKFTAFCQRAKNDKYDYIWIDTCCIDKTSSAELTEAINSMYRWYKRASICYAYLFDFEEELLGIEFDSMTESKWFTRSWTLQELIAPQRVEFFDRHFELLSTKADCISELSTSTGIPETVLSCQEPPNERRVSEIMQWAAHRVASREEDIAYSLLGLFDVNMPMLYGEGPKAFVRLQEEILKQNPDRSIFLSKSDGSGEIFAASPAHFLIGEQPDSIVDWVPPEPCSMTNLGVSIVLDVIPYAMNIYVARLEGLIYANRKYPFIFLRLVQHNICERVILNGLHILKGSLEGRESGRRQLFIGSAARFRRTYEPTFFGFDVCFREKSEQSDKLIDLHQITLIDCLERKQNPCVVRFEKKDQDRIFEIWWTDGRHSTVRIRFGLDFKPVCLIKDVAFGRAMSNPEALGIRSAGDNIRNKTYSEATGLESVGWSTSDQSLSFPTMDDFWAIKGPVEATRLVNRQAGPVDLSVELMLSNVSHVEGQSIWCFTLIKNV